MDAVAYLFQTMQKRTVEKSEKSFWRRRVVSVTTRKSCEGTKFENIRMPEAQ